jgi:16S rRNA (cytosine1407-C5)-methyltransferase
MLMAKNYGHRGEAAFRAYYGGLFGERWPALEAALAAEPDSVAFRSGEGQEPYFMDSASIFAAQSLQLPPEGKILDACAAPGGKSLVLASRMGLRTTGPRYPGTGLSLVSNELSADRRRRLREVLDRHLTPELRARVQTTARDAAAMCRSFEAAFDAILLDAPCSSERHVLRQACARSEAGRSADKSALAEWSPARIRGLAMRQWALLSSALIMLKTGGCLVYSTCALSPDENDGVVARARAKHRAADGGLSLRFDKPVYEGPRGMDGAEETEYGISILPDRNGGAGPMYICRIWKEGR